MEMEIRVMGPPPWFVQRIRTYAEYRVFSRLAPLARDVTAVRVVISQTRAGGMTSCSLRADLGRAGAVRTRSRRAQPTRAIDSAAERLIEAVARRLRAR